MHVAAMAVIAVPLLSVGPANAQTVTDGSDSALVPGDSNAVFALIGKGMKAPSSALDSRLRRGRAGAVCGEVE